MKGFRLICLAAIAVQSVWSGAAASGDATNPAGAGTTTTRLPPVLRPLDPPDSGQITLPGPSQVAPAPVLKKVIAPPEPAWLRPSHTRHRPSRLRLRPSPNGSAARQAGGKRRDSPARTSATGASDCAHAPGPPDVRAGSLGLLSTADRSLEGKRRPHTPRPAHASPTGLRRK